MVAQNDIINKNKSIHINRDALSFSGVSITIIWDDAIGGPQADRTSSAHFRWRTWEGSWSRVWQDVPWCWHWHGRACSAAKGQKYCLASAALIHTRIKYINWILIKDHIYIYIYLSQHGTHTCFYTRVHIQIYTRISLRLQRIASHYITLHCIALYLYFA